MRKRRGMMKRKIFHAVGKKLFTSLLTVALACGGDCPKTRNRNPSA
jgi:hypothetical protein